MSSEVAVDVGSAALACLTWYYVVIEFLPIYRKEKEKDSYDLWREKRLAWIMTLLSAIFASTVSIVYVMDLTIAPETLEMPFELRHLVDLDSYRINTPKLMEYLFYHDRLSLLSMRFFCTYLSIDTIYMYLYYRNVSNVVSWIHHIGYAIVMATTLLTVAPCPMIFVVFFPLEISTLFLASGSIWPRSRQDALFGATFFIFRVIYHGALVVFLLYNLASIRGYRKLYAIGASMSWVMHCHWFHNWFKKYSRKSTVTAQNDTKKKVT